MTLRSRTAQCIGLGSFLFVLQFYPQSPSIVGSYENGNQYGAVDRKESHKCSGSIVAADEPVYEAKEIVTAKVKKHVAPKHPGKAGYVAMELLIDKQGIPQCIEVLASSYNDGTIEKQCADAVKQWRFTPAEDKAGIPVCCYQYQKIDIK